MDKLNLKALMLVKPLYSSSRFFIQMQNIRFLEIMFVFQRQQNVTDSDTVYLHGEKAILIVVCVT